MFILYSMNIHDEIRAIREKLGLNQREFARKIKVTFAYVGQMERTPKKGEKPILPSPEIIKRIANVAGKTEEEKKSIYRKLLLERAKATLPDEIKDIFDENKEKQIIGGGGMPLPFISRLKEDLKKNRDNLEFIYKQTGLTREDLKSVLESRGILTREKVISLALALKQPVDQYLILADYMPDELKEYLSNQHLLAFRKLSKLSPEDINQMVDVLENTLRFLKDFGGAKTSDKEGSS